MGVFIRPDSPYFWVRLEQPSGRAKPEPTKIPHVGPKETAKQRRRDAEAYYNARMTQLAKARVGLPTGEPEAAPDPAPLFCEFADWFETHKIPQRRGAQREREILKILRPFFNPKRLDEITKPLTQEWMTARRSPTVSARTVNREVDVLKSILQAAVEAGHLAESPLYGMRQLKVLAPKRRLMTPDEEARLLAVLAPDDKAILLLGLDSLIRLNDILDLHRADLDLAGARVYVRDPKGQRASPYHAPLSARTRAALAALPPVAASEPFLFPRRRVAKTESDRGAVIRAMLKTACAKATPPIPYGRTLGGITFHWATRRTGATRMLQGGADMKAVQTVGNWKTATIMFDIYNETTTDAMRAAVEVVGAPPAPPQPPPARHAPARVVKARFGVRGEYAHSQTRKFAQ